MQIVDLVDLIGTHAKVLVCGLKLSAFSSTIKQVRFHLKVNQPIRKLTLANIPFFGRRNHE